MADTNNTVDETLVSSSSVQPTIDDGTPPSSDYKYIVARTNLINEQLVTAGGGDPALHCVELFHLHDTVCYEISSTLFNTLRTTWLGRVIEIDYPTAHWGSIFFSEIRTVGKILEKASGPWTQPAKIPVEIEPLVPYIVSFMKTIAIETIHQEYDRRLAALGSRGEVEKASWEIQKHEAREWLNNQGANGSKTPFLDYLATEHGVDKTELANTILEKAETYADSLSELLVSSQKLIKELKTCSTVWDTNIFYEKYLGVMMPDKQAVQIPGWTVSDTDTTRVTKVIPNEFNF